MSMVNRRSLRDHRVRMSTPCIEGRVGPKSRYVSHGRHSHAHRFAYEQANGPIPAGLEIDHLCRNTLCINPEHLEAVTHLENIRRAFDLITECVNGHVFTEANTYTGRGQRECRTCHRERERRRHARRQA